MAKAGITVDVRPELMIGDQPGGISPLVCVTGAMAKAGITVDVKPEMMIGDQPGGVSPLVCVTGATGHLGSWLVMTLLNRGYTVRATVIDPAHKEEFSFLMDLPFAKERLSIMRGQLLEEGSFDDAVRGCDGVFHCASPTEFSFTDPFKECIEPAVQGSLNVLRSCVKSPSIKRVVFASSAAAIRFTTLEDVPNQIFNEECWTDVDMCLREKMHGWPYFVSKTLSEQKAYEFARENGLDLVTILPTIVTGPFLIEKMPNSLQDFLSLLTGDSSHYPFIRRISYVHIDDAINAFIFLFEEPRAQGRFICSTVDISIGDMSKLLSQKYPNVNIPKDFEYLGNIVPHYMDSSKLKGLGFEFKNGLNEMIESAIKCCKEKGLLHLKA